MNSWKIIENILIQGTDPDTPERDTATAKAAFLFIALKEVLNDYDLSIAEMSKERDRISSEAQFENIRNTGAI